MYRYLLFAGNFFYALGGAHDLVDSFEEIADAKLEGRTMMQEEEIEWWHVFDTVSKQIVARSPEQAYGVDD